MQIFLELQMKKNLSEEESKHKKHQGAFVTASWCTLHRVVANTSWLGISNYLVYQAIFNLFAARSSEQIERELGVRSRGFC